MPGMVMTERSSDWIDCEYRHSRLHEVEFWPYQPAV